MIDTFILKTKIFTIKEINRLHIVKITNDKFGKDRKHYLYTKDNGKHVYGKKAFYNYNYSNETFTIEIKHNPFFQIPTRFGKSNDQKNYIYIKLSVAGYEYINNSKLKYFTQIKRIIYDIVERLSYFGILLSEEDLIVNRIDVFQDIILDYPVYKYQTLLKNVNIPRLDRKSYDSTHDFTVNKKDKILGSTTYFRNKSHSLVFYDKIAQLKYYKKKNTYNHGYVMRAEYRLMKPEKIKSIFGTNKYIDLIKMENFIEIIYLFYDFVDKFIFNQIYTSKKPIRNDSLLERIEFISQFSKKPVDIMKYIEVIGTYRLLRKHSIDDILEIANTSNGRTFKHRIKAQLEELSSYAQTLKKMRIKSKICDHDLFLEFKSKFQNQIKDYIDKQILNVA